MLHKYLIVPVLAAVVGAASLEVHANEPPRLSNLSVEADAVQKRIHIFFDVFDKENDTVTVTLKVSVDKGETFLMDVKNAEGDFNVPMQAGKSKKIIWSYDELGDLSNVYIKVIAKDNYRIKAEDLLTEVDTARLRHGVNHVFGERNHRTRKTARRLGLVKDYIEDQFRSNRLQTTRQTASKEVGYPIQNIIGTKPGLASESTTYVLCAHFDTVTKSPGADDNGSGISGMLEAMRILSKYNFDHSIKFIGFDFEEKNLGGSYLYTFYNGKKEHENIEGVINFDMIGYYSTLPGSQQIPPGFENIFPDAVKTVKASGNKGDFVICTSNTASLPLANAFRNNTDRHVSDLKLVLLETTDNGRSAPALADSDHASFWNKGYKAVHIGDGADTRNIYMHTKDDAAEHINYSFMSGIVKATIATIIELAQIQNSTIAISSVSARSAE